MPSEENAQRHQHHQRIVVRVGQIVGLDIAHRQQHRRRQGNRQPTQDDNRNKNSLFGGIGKIDDVVARQEIANEGQKTGQKGDDPAAIGELSQRRW